MAWVAEMTGYDMVAAQNRTLLFAMGPGIAFTDTTYAPGALKRWVSATQKISFDQSGAVQSGADAGEIVVTNQPDDLTEAGPWDHLAEWAWQGRQANLYWVPAALWSARVLMATAALEQPVGRPLGDGDATMTFPLRDPRAALSGPLQATTFKGTGGAEGSADAKGSPKPIGYGINSNIPGVRVGDEVKLMWMLCDKAATILCVRDGAVPISASVGRANLASMEANDPVPGTYDWVSNSEGTFVRMGTRPVARFTSDFAEGATAALRTHAQIWSRIRQERCGTAGGSILAASVTATDLLAPNETGFWWPGSITKKEAIDEVLASLSGYEVLDTAGKWNISKLIAPAGAPVINLMLLQESSILKATDRPMLSLTRVRPGYATDGAPPYAVTVRWGKNYTPMSPGDFNGASGQRLQDKFREEWRTERATNSTIWNPDTLTGLFPNAPELFINTGYQPGPDGLTSPHALAEASERLVLYSGLKAHYQSSFIPGLGDQILPGQVVRLTHPGYGLAAGPLFRVMQAGLTVEGDVAKAAVVVGLQT